MARLIVPRPRPGLIATRPAPTALGVQLFRPRAGDAPSPPSPGTPTVRNIVAVAAGTSPVSAAIGAGTPTYPNTILVAVVKGSGGVQPSPITDSLGRTWTRVANAGTAATVTIQYVNQGANPLPVGGTITQSDGGANSQMYVLELSNVAAFDQAANGVSNTPGVGLPSTYTTPATAALAAVPQVAVTAVTYGGLQAPANIGTITSDTGWTYAAFTVADPPAITGNRGIGLAWKLITAAGPVGPVVWSHPAQVTNIVGATATFRP